MKLASHIRFKDEILKSSFESLEKSDERLFKAINHALDNIERNAFCGVQIPKRLIPKDYDTKNLWKYDLPSGWRLMYSVINEEIVIISLILEWLDHKDYERRFKY